MLTNGLLILQSSIKTSGAASTRQVPRAFKKSSIISLASARKQTAQGIHHVHQANHNTRVNVNRRMAFHRLLLKETTEKAIHIHCHNDLRSLLELMSILTRGAYQGGHELSQMANLQRQGAHPPRNSKPLTNLRSYTILLQLGLPEYVEIFEKAHKKL